LIFVPNFVVKVVFININSISYKYLQFWRFDNVHGLVDFGHMSTPLAQKRQFPQFVLKLITPLDSVTLISYKTIEFYIQS